MSTLDSQLERLQLNDPFENASRDQINEIPRIKAINYLELFNFKSYADYHYIGPFLNFTSVIGPNGGGKSNILDALCFLFCINPKNSRVYSMTELIYNREKVQSSRNIAEQRELWVAGSFTCEDTDSLKLRRNLSGSGDSEFYVNNQKVTVEEYYKILYRNNVNTFAKNFLIMQGEAVALLEKTPKDLSTFFEYLSGSIVHKDKYDELKKITDDKENDLKEQQQKLAYLKSERRKLREKIENSKEYNKLSKKLDQTELLNQLVRLLEVDRQCYENVKMLRVYDEAIEGHKKKREDEGLKLQGNSIARKKVQNDIKKEQKNFETKKDELSKLRADLTRDQTLEEMTGQTLQAKKITKTKFETDLAAVRENEKNLAEAIRDLEQQLKNLDEKIKQQKKDPSEKLTGRDYDEYRELNQKMKMQSHLLTQQLEKLYNDQKILISRGEKTEEELQRKNTALTKLKSENAESTGLIQNKENAIANLGKELNKLKTRFGEVSKKKEDKVRERASLQTLRDTRNQLLLKQELLTLNQKDESKTKALFMDLIKNAKGFKGDLGSLVKPIQPRFEIALRLALGPAMKYLVVDKNETALICSNILKDKSIMKDILVLENIPEVSTAEMSSIRSQLGGLGNLANDIADYERSIVGLEKALLFLLEGKVVCENLGKVDAIKKRNIDGVRQLITLDGNVVKKGVIVGHGDPERLAAGGRFADNLGGNLEDEIAKLQKEVVDIEEKVKGLRTDEEDLEIHRISEAMREIDGKINVEKEAKAKLQEKMNKDEQEVTNERRNQNQVQSEKNKFEADSKELQKRIDGIKKEIDKLEESVFGAFLKRLGLPSVKEFRGEQITEFERTVEEKEKLEKKLRNLKKERDELPIRKYEGLIDEVTKTIREKETTLAEAKERLSQNKKKMDQANKQYEQAKSLVDGLAAEDKKLADEISQLEKGFDQEKGDLLEQERLRRERVNSVNQLLQRKKEMIEELQIKSIEVPFAGAEIDNSPQVIFEDYEDLFKKYFSAWNGRTAIDYTQLMDKEEKKPKDKEDKDEEEDSEEGMDIESEESREDPEQRFRKWFEDMTGDKLEAKKKEYEATLQTVTEKIDNYAGTSFPAGQESSRRLERFEREINDAKEEVDDLTKSHEDALKQFEKVKQERVKQFDHFFEKLAARIDETYKSLTRQNGGAVGRAIVYKENKEEPFNGGIFYSATPPTKKFVYDTDQLSGGEKTMAGLALMLTANIVSGFPFMFFDESDAFLDQGNTRQLLEVIKLLTEKNLMQIIVVTHKNMIYGSAQSLVGATFVPKQSTSECYSLDLRK